MTKFLLTMNMPSRSGHEVHQIIAMHRAETLADFVEYLDNHEFVVIEEFYYDNGDKQKLFSRGEIALNYRYIGKIKMISG